MRKHKLFFFSALFIVSSFIFSCQKVQEPTDVKPADNTHLSVDATKIKKEYELKYNTETSLELDGLNVKINGNDVTDLSTQRAKNAEEAKQENKYYLCTNKDLPSFSIVSSLTISSNTDVSTLTFYVATTLKEDQTIDKYTTYISDKIDITIKNPVGGIKQWVWFVVSGVVIFGVIGMVMFTRYYKNKKNNN